MGWKLANRPSTQKVTRKLAREVSEMEASPNDRHLSETRLTVYEKLLRQGSFRPVTWAFAYCEETGGTYRVNGKHTSTMLSTFEPLPDFYVTIEEYKCDTLEDVTRLYATFDSKMQSRTARDIYLSFAGTIPELANLPAKTVCNCASALGIAEKGIVDHVRLTASERAELLFTWPEFVLFADAIISGSREFSANKKKDRKSSMHLQRAAVIAAMKKSWDKEKKQASEFWSAVRDKSGANQNCPDRKLAEFLTSVGIRSNERGKLKHATQREVFVKCIHAWNAYRAGTDTDMKYYSDKPVPACK